MKIQLKNGGIPKQPGKYFAVSSSGVEMINIVLIHGGFRYGVECSDYLAVSEWGGKNVEKYEGSSFIWFSEKIEFEIKAINS